MRLFFGRENRLAYSNDLDNNAGWLSATATQGSDIIAPDGSSAAQTWTTPASSTLRLDTVHSFVVSRAEGSYPYDADRAYICSFYAKATSDLETPCQASFTDNQGGSSFFWAGAFTFTDGTVSSHTSYTAGGSAYIGVARFGRQYVGNGWYRFWHMHDVRDNENQATITNASLRIFPNYQGSNAGVGIGVWGVQIELTRRRFYPTPLTLTDGTASQIPDYTMCEFTQLPSNISEIENNIYGRDPEYTVIGNVFRRTKYLDKEVYSMIWEKVNYKKHGEMIYLLRQSCVDRLKRSCVLEYPGPLKRQIRSADIRVIDFSLEYLDIRDMARVEIKYSIENTYPY